MPLYACSHIPTPSAASFIVRLSEAAPLIFDLTSVCASGALWGGCSTAAGRSSRRQESSTLRSPAGAGKEASVATATGGRRSRRLLPQEPGPASRQTPGDEAEDPDYWRGSKTNFQSIRPSIVNWVQRWSFTVNTDFTAITSEVSWEQWRRRWQRWASGALWWATLQKDQSGEHEAKRINYASVVLLLLSLLPAAVNTSGNRE